VSKYKTLSRLVSLNIGADLVFSDREEIENDLRGLKDNPFVRYIIVTDDSGTIFASYHPEIASKVRYRSSGSELKTYYEERLYSTSTPLHHEGQLIGTLYLGFSLSQMEEEVTQIRKAIGIVCMIIFLLGAVAVFAISSVVTRPLSDIAKAAEEIARGDLKTRARESVQFEINRLAQAFNMMVNNLVTVQNDLIEINQTLEQRVYERTEKLYQEIVTRQKAEEQLRVSDEILKRVSSLILVFDEQGNATYVSPSIKTVLGYSPESILGNGWWQLVQQGKVSEGPTKIETATAARGEMRLSKTAYEQSIIASKGTTHWITWQNTKGPSNLLICVGHDITERKYSEQVLLESEKRYRLLFEHNPLPGWVYDAETLVFLAVNEAAINQYGFSRNEFHSMTLRDIYLPEDIPQLLKPDQYATFPLFGIWRHVKKNKTIIDVEISTHALMYMGRSCRLALAKDITERRRYEVQLRNLSFSLQSVREEERAWIAREIHDELGQMLTGMKMYVNGMLISVAESTDQTLKSSISERLSATAELIQQMINSVQKISTELRPDLLDKLGLVAAVEWQTQEFEKLYHIPCEVTTDLDDSYLSQHCVITLFRVVQEALTNVARHAEATNVTILLLIEDEEIYLEIKDNGKGITHEEIMRPNALGITGIRERVSSLSGNVQITGEPGQGTIIAVRAPLSSNSRIS
ncbi:MAG: PAS domain S-box protein, partial [Bacteroidetes bacterium]